MQLATISLLFSLGTSAVSVVPALMTPTAPVVEESTASQAMQIVGGQVDIKNYEPITDSKNVEKYVRDYFSDIPLLAKIAGCESHFRQYDKTGDVLHGEQNRYDRGVMQINTLYHEKTATEMDLDLMKLEDNVAYARYLYEKQGAKPWMSSSPCWAKTTQSEIAKK